MSRRVVARKNIRASVLAWVRAYQGTGLVGAYRKHYHVSSACAILELSMMGVAFPAEDIEEAKRKQPAAIQSVQARKAKKKANKVAQMMPSAAEISYWDIHNWKDDEPWVIAEKFANKSMPNLSGVESKPRAAAVDEYDPFADD